MTTKVRYAEGPERPSPVASSPMVIDGMSFLELLAIGLFCRLGWGRVGFFKYLQWSRNTLTALDIFFLIKTANA